MSRARFPGSPLEVVQPWIRAIVPALGFMISTLTMPFFKRRWMEHHDAGAKKNP
ncbi:MAG: hypothetical protein AAB916_01385 [Patescibacteria group bacterium]